MHIIKCIKLNANYNNFNSKQADYAKMQFVNTVEDVKCVEKNELVKIKKKQSTQATQKKNLETLK